MSRVKPAQLYRNIYNDLTNLAIAWFHEFSEGWAWISFRRYTLEVAMQPAYDLRKLEIEISDFQEWGLRVEKVDCKTAKIHVDLAMRRDSVVRTCRDRTCGCRPKPAGR